MMKYPQTAACVRDLQAPDTTGRAAVTEDRAPRRRADPQDVPVPRGRADLPDVPEPCRREEVPEDPKPGVRGELR